MIDGHCKNDKARREYSNQDVKDAIEKGLEYLKDNQLANGGWDGGAYGINSNIVGSCLRAFIDYDHNDPRWKETINKAIMFFTNVWHDPADYPAGRARDFYGGGLWNDRIQPHGYSHGKMYSQGAATAALIDYFYRTQNISLLPYINESVKLIIRAQESPNRPSTLSGPRSNGGWRYDPGYTSSDTSITGWNLHALILAEVLDVCNIPDNAFEYAEKWLERVSSGSGFGYRSASSSYTNTGVGVYCMYLLGKGNTASVQGGLTSLMNWGPRYATSKFYYTYHATLAMYLAGGNDWNDWSENITDMLLDSQVQDGSWNGEYGVIWGTAMALMTLELCINNPTQVSLEPREDVDTGEVEELKKYVGTDRSITYNVSLALKPECIEIPLSGINGKERIEITISDPIPGWKADLDTPAEDDGVTQPDGSKMWWADLSLWEGNNLTLTVTSPKTGGWKERCDIDIITTMDNKYGSFRNNITTTSILNLTADFEVETICEVDEFLGVKAMGITPGEKRILSVAIENTGDLNDSYSLRLDCPTDWVIYFDNMQQDTTISLNEIRYHPNKDIVNITVIAPEDVMEGDMINITVFARSRVHSDLGLGLLEKGDGILLLVLEPAITLQCGNVRKRVNPGDRLEYTIVYTNNFHSELRIESSFSSPQGMAVSLNVHPQVWSAAFPEPEISIPSKEQREVVFRVNVPPNAVEGTVKEITIYAVGNDNDNGSYNAEPITVETVVNNRPRVTLLEPANEGTLTATSVDLSWSCLDHDDMDQDISYDLFFGEDRDLEGAPSSIVEESVSLDGLRDGAVYYWKVVPSDPIGMGDCGSGIWSFSINTTLELPRVNLISPVNQTTSDTNFIKLMWRGSNLMNEDPVYYVDMGTSPARLKNVGTTRDPWYEVYDLDDHTTYYWQVIPVTSSGKGICNSGIWMFTIEIPIIYMLDVRLDVDEIEIMQGESLTVNLTMENLGNAPVTPLLSRSGPLADHVIIPDQTALEIDSSRTIPITISIPNDLLPETYILTIDVNYSHGCKELVLPVTVREMEASIQDDQNISERRSSQPWFWMLLVIVIIIAISLVLCIIIFLGRKKDDPDQNQTEIIAEIEHVPVIHGNPFLFPDNGNPITGPNIPFPSPVGPNQSAGIFPPGRITPGPDYAHVPGGAPVPDTRFSQIWIPQVPARKPIQQIKALPMKASTPVKQHATVPTQTTIPSPVVNEHAVVKSNSNVGKKIISKPLVTKKVAQPSISPVRSERDELPAPPMAQHPPPPPPP